jgi:hypothetical protein
MSDDVTRTDKLVSATLKLRTALSATLLALADIEGASSLEEACERARIARCEARAILATARRSTADDRTSER